MKGVHWNKARKRWKASIRSSLGCVNLGSYKDKEEAEFARRAGEECVDLCKTATTGICCICGEVIIQAKRGPKRTKFCSKRCHALWKRSDPGYAEWKREYDAIYREENADRIIRNREVYKDTEGYNETLFRRRLKIFNITEQWLEGMIISQVGKCAICGIDFIEMFSIDHDHDTGKARGLLCNSCNSGIGFLKDSKDTCLKAAKYLESYEESPM